MVETMGRDTLLLLPSVWNQPRRCRSPMTLDLITLLSYAPTSAQDTHIHFTFVPDCGLVHAPEDHRKEDFYHVQQEQHQQMLIRNKTSILKFHLGSRKYLERLSVERHHHLSVARQS
jgi:hypothetical protein